MGYPEVMTATPEEVQARIDSARRMKANKIANVLQDQGATAETVRLMTQTAPHGCRVAEQLAGVTKSSGITWGLVFSTLQAREASQHRANVTSLVDKINAAAAQGTANALADAIVGIGADAQAIREAEGDVFDELAQRGLAAKNDDPFDLLPERRS